MIDSVFLSSFSVTDLVSIIEQAKDELQVRKAGLCKCYKDLQLLIKAEYETYGKIAAIEIMRDLVGSGLKEAKDQVELWAGEPTSGRSPNGGCNYWVVGSKQKSNNY
jgi:ribosomal protein L7/L12